ncbi:hypothetical protein ACPA9J_04105 [Pseudomonas aeruginosa]
MVGLPLRSPEHAGAVARPDRRRRRRLGVYAKQAPHAGEESPLLSRRRRPATGVDLAQHDGVGGLRRLGNQPLAKRQPRPCNSASPIIPPQRADRPEAARPPTLRPYWPT